MHRDLAFHKSKLRAPLELQGRTVRKSEHSPSGSLGKWENFIGRDKVKNHRDVANRWQDYGNAPRTIHPDLNDSEIQHKTRRIAPREESPNPGNLLNLFKKTGTLDEVYNSKKKFFKEKPREEDLTPKKSIRPHLKKQDDLCSHIDTLTSPTFRTEESSYQTCRSPSSASKTSQLRQDFLKSAISVLPCGEDTKRSFQDRDEVKITQSACAPKVARHLETTLDNQPLSASAKKVSNRQHNNNSQDYYLINPYSKGRKNQAPVPNSEYFSQDQSSILPRNQTSHSYRSGSMEPLDPMYVGRRAVTPQKQCNNIMNPPKEKGTPRGQAVFSYRTYASQITF